MPDLNIVCFLLCPQREFTLSDLNALYEEIYQRLSVQHPYDAPEYVLSRTVLRSPIYKEVAQPILEKPDRSLAR